MVTRASHILGKPQSQVDATPSETRIDGPAFDNFARCNFRHRFERMDGELIQNVSVRRAGQPAPDPGRKSMRYEYFGVPGDDGCRENVGARRFPLLPVRYES